jgi:hypothetical protein
MSEKICTQCVNYEYRSYSDYCKRKQFTTSSTNLVNGKVTVIVGRRPCNQERKINWLVAIIERRCGERGRFFKQKQEVDKVQ